MNRQTFDPGRGYLPHRSCFIAVVSRATAPGPGPTKRPVVSQDNKELDQLVIPHLVFSRTKILNDRLGHQRALLCEVSIAGSVWRTKCQRRVTALRLLAGSFLVLLAALVAPAQAQQFNGTLRGVVQDSTGGVLPGAAISVVEVSTNDTRSLTSDARGSWVLPNLKPGTYRIVVSIDGFKTAAIDNVKLDVQGIRDVEIKLEVGAAAETVTVSGQAAAVEVTSSTMSQTIENKRMVDLPLNGRNPFSLASLAPGVAPTSNNGGSSPSISGGRNATSEVAIDGVSNVNAENNVSILDLNYTPSVDAVQEFSVQTNAVSAEFGRLGGGVINLITKSGSNSLRATAWEFARNAKMDATNFFTNRGGGKKGAFKRNQFGGNLGGPINRDKTFFFVNYEGLREQNASVQTFTVPLPEWRTGDFSNFRNGSGQLITIYDPLTTRADPANPGQFIRDPFPGNVIPQNRMSPMARAMIGYWPLPNAAPTNQFTQTNNFSASGFSENQGDRIDSRVDHVVQRPLAHVRPLLVLGRSQPAVQQLQQRGLVGRRRRPDLHQGAQPVGRSQLHARADLGAERPLRAEPPLRVAPADLGRLRPVAAELPDERAEHGRRAGIPTRERAELPVTRPEHLHRPGDRADDAQLQRQRDQGLGPAHPEDGRRLPQVPAQLHAAVLPRRPVQLR